MTPKANAIAALFAAAIVSAALLSMALISDLPAAVSAVPPPGASAWSTDATAAQPVMLRVAPLRRGAEPEALAQSCKLIRAEVRSCGCTVDFLVTHLGSEQAAILLEVWAAGGGYAGDTTAAFAALYRQHDHATVLRATSGFSPLSTEFQQQCLPWGDMFSE